MDDIRKEKNRAYQKAWRLKNKDKVDKYYEDQKRKRLENSETYRSYLKAWRAENKEYAKDQVLKKKYGITLEAYELLRKAQKYKCALCRIPLDTGIAVVDHCHKTGKVRGILHSNCNALIGFAKEDTKILNLAVKYIVRTRTTPALNRNVGKENGPEEANVCST
jgi:hypothetical protein